jgi:hypothetical protein
LPVTGNEPAQQVTGGRPVGGGSDPGGSWVTGTEVPDTEVCTVLSAHEQRTWDEIERLYDLDAAEPARPHRGVQEEPDGGIAGVDDLPAGVVAGCWAAILLVLFGLVPAGLAVGGLTALGWLLWRLRPLQGRRRDGATGLTRSGAPRRVTGPGR